MQYFEVEGNVVDDIMVEICSPMITVEVNKRSALKMYPSVSTEMARRTGILYALLRLDLITSDQKEEILLRYQKDLNRLSDVLKVSKLFK